MELKLNSGDVITIPDDCKAVIKDKIITVEKEIQEFKDGDFVSLNNVGGRFLIIYKSKNGNHSANYHAVTYNGNYENKVVSYDDWCIFDDARISTEEEKQLLIDAMHADGKDWDADKKQIVDYKWKPKSGEVYYHIDYSFNIQIDSLVWYDDALDEIHFSNGNCFKTKEEAQKYADKFVEILKERKL